MRVKSGDTDVVSWRANADLTGATLRLIAQSADHDPVYLDAEMGETTGVVTHRLTGELPSGTYRVVLKVIRDGVKTTFPNKGYATLTVADNLD